MAILSTQNIKGLIALEPVFQSIVDQYGLPDDWSRPDGFPTLCKIILEQQVSLDSALATWNKLVDRLGEINPQTILSLDQAAMKNCYVTRQKTTYLHALANAVMDGSLDLSQLGQLSKEDVETELIKIKGIGPWTAQVYLIFALQSEDIYPKGDVALNNAVRELFNVASKEEIYVLSDKWSPYRTTASFLLWHQYLSKRGRVWKG